MVKNISTLNLVLGLILIGILSRLIPHAPNFTAVGATALFAGAVIKPGWLSYLLPLTILWISDLYLNNGIYKNMFPESYTGWRWMGDGWVYAGFLIIVLVGKLYIQKIKVKNILIGSLAASLLFFMLTNFGVWLGNPAWPQTPTGLGSCYLFALPFFWNTLAADLIFSSALFGIFILSRNAFRPHAAIIQGKG